MNKIAVFPGSFNPITLGHVEIVKRALPLFDKLIIGIGVNSQKKYYFSLEQRIQWINETFKDDPKIEVKSYDYLTVDFCKENNARYLVRGLRNVTDFDYEKTISQLNAVIGDGLETVFFICSPDHSLISSSVVREIIKGGGDASHFLPEAVKV